MIDAKLTDAWPSFLNIRRHCGDAIPPMQPSWHISHSRIEMMIPIHVSILFVFDSDIINLKLLEILDNCIVPLMPITLICNFYF